MHKQQLASAAEGGVEHVFVAADTFSNGELTYPNPSEGCWRWWLLRIVCRHVSWLTRHSRVVLSLSAHNSARQRYASQMCGNPGL